MFEPENNFYNQPLQPQPNEIRFKVISGYMIDSGTHNPEFTRPYTANVDGDVYSLFMNATDNGANINRNSLSSIANSIIQPRTIPDAMVNIDNGWGTSRILFMFEIGQVGSPLSTVIQGYADKSDVSFGGHIDPQLRLYFNSVISLTSYEQNTPNGVIRRKKVIDNSHIFGDNHLRYLTPYEQRPQHLPAVYTQRPVDVAHNLGYEGLMLEGGVLDCRTRLLEHSPIKSKRGNSSAPQYLSETIGKLTSEFDATGLETGFYESPQEVYNAAASSLRESSLAQDNVLRYISMYTNFNSEGCVTWGQMVNLFPDIDEVTDYIKRTGSVVQTNEHFVSEAGAFADWSVASYETLAATQVMQTIPTFLTQAMLISGRGTFNNDTLTGEPQVHVDGETFIQGFDTTRSLKILFHRIVSELMPGLTMHNQRCINIAFNINLLRDAWIAVSIDGGPIYEYSSPCYADALLAPTCVTDEMSLKNIASTIDGLANTVTQ